MLIPAGENSFDFLLVPRLIGDLVFQAHIEADVPEGIRLAEPLVVVRDRLFLGRQRVLQHFPRLVGVGNRTRLGRRFAAQGRDLVRQELSVSLLVRNLGLERARNSLRYGPVNLAEYWVYITMAWYSPARSWLRPSIRACRSAAVGVGLSLPAMRAFAASFVGVRTGMVRTSSWFAVHDARLTPRA